MPRHSHEGEQWVHDIHAMGARLTTTKKIIKGNSATEMFKIFLNHVSHTLGDLEQAMPLQDMSKRKNSRHSTFHRVQAKIEVLPYRHIVWVEDVNNVTKENNPKSSDGGIKRHVRRRIPPPKCRATQGLHTTLLLRHLNQ